MASAKLSPHVKIIHPNLSTPSFFLNSSAIALDVAYLSPAPSLIISKISSGAVLPEANDFCALTGFSSFFYTFESEETF
jgi:hypothetical protein